MFDEIYTKLLFEAKKFVDPHALGNIRQIEKFNKILPEHSKKLLYNGFKIVGQYKNWRE